MSDPAERARAHVRALAGPARAGVPGHARITVNFHPDRLAGTATVAQLLARDGVYRSQFETGISNGGLTAYPGGDRDRWEQRMFAGAYAGGQVTGRPVYGALNLAGHPDGAAPRFGSCHLRLTAAVTERATFSHGDSATEPGVVGTADTFGAVWAALLEQVARTGAALGVPADGPRQWAAALGVPADGPRQWAAALSAPRRDAGRSLDDYVEAQVHGPLLLATDVEAVVADPSFAGTATGDLLASLSPVLQFHPGFVLAPHEFPAALRGPAAAALAVHLGQRYAAPLIDAALLGRAARSVVRRPAAWAAVDEPLQQLKYLWHILVLRGRPAG